MIHAFSQDRFYAPERFQHCPTLAALDGNTLVAFYAGTRECSQDQKVKIFYNSRKNPHIHELEENTGNPILLTVDDYKAVIIYSEFTKTTGNPGAMWQYCKTWVREIKVVYDDLIEIGGRRPLIVTESFDDNPPEEIGYLARCHPIAFEDGWLLPLYREHRPRFHGVVMFSKDGLNWEYRGTIGRGTSCIQPTIWLENGKVCALMRNFARNRDQTAYYSESDDGGRTWSDLEGSQFPNYNNSILAINCPNGDKETQLFIWNDDPTGRNNISLGTADRKLVLLDGYGSYPAACILDDQLHVAYMGISNQMKTPHAKSVIKHKAYSLPALMREARGKPTLWSGKA